MVRDPASDFAALAAEVRGSYNVLISKLKAIKMSMDEAKASRRYAEAADKVGGGEEGQESSGPSLVKLVRPETPHNVRGLYRATRKDISRLREMFVVVVEAAGASVATDDRRQVERILEDLERQLDQRSRQLTALKAGRSAARAAANSARRSARRPLSPKKSSPPGGTTVTAGTAMAVDATRPTTKERSKTNDVSSPQSCGQSNRGKWANGRVGTPGSSKGRGAPPVVSTKVIRPALGRHAVTSDHRLRRRPPPPEPPHVRRERTWGAFHGQRSLSKDTGAEPVLKLPPANFSPSLVSSGSQNSDSDATCTNQQRLQGKTGEVREGAPFNSIGGANGRCQGQSRSLPKQQQQQQTKPRLQARLQPRPQPEPQPQHQPGLQLQSQARSQVVAKAGPTEKSRQEPTTQAAAGDHHHQQQQQHQHPRQRYFRGPDAIQREFTSLLDLNLQVDSTLGSPLGVRAEPGHPGLPARVPSHLAAGSSGRSSGAADFRASPALRAVLRGPAIPGGSPVPRLPPLASLRRGVMELSPDR